MNRVYENSFLRHWEPAFSEGQKMNDSGNAYNSVVTYIYCSNLHHIYFRGRGEVKEKYKKYIETINTDTDFNR